MTEPGHRRFMRQIEDGQARPVNGKQRFRFRCSQCGACCRDNEILLKPYDIYRLSRSLGVRTAEFLNTYCVTYVGKDSGLPLVMLRFLEDGRGACPFLRNGTCAVHADRPSVCRLFPLGAVGGTGRPKRFYLQPTQCPGYGRGKPKKLRHWLKESGLREYLAQNERFFALVGSLMRSGVLKARRPVILFVIEQLLYNSDDVLPSVAERKRVPVPTEWPAMFGMVEEELTRLTEAFMSVLQEKDAA